MQGKEKAKIVCFSCAIIAYIGFKCFEAQTDEMFRIKRGDIKYSEMAYSHIGASRIEKLFQPLSWTNNGDTYGVGWVKSWDERFNDLYSEIATMSTLADIKYYIGDNDRDYLAEQNHCKELLQEMEDRYNEMYSEDYDEEAATQESALYMHQLELQNDYKQLEETVAIDEDGEMYTLDELEDYTYYEEWSEAYKEEAGQLLLELAKTQNEMADLYGYDTVSEMMYDWYGRDFTVEETEAFYDYVKKYVPPVLEQLSDYGMEMEVPDSIYSYNEEGMLDSFEKVLKEASPKFEQVFKYMRKYELYHIFYDEHYERNNEAYTWYLDEYNEPFIYLTGQNSCIITDSLAHEFGHFFSDFAVEEPYFSTDMDETYSQGMEALILPKADEILGSQEAQQIVQADALFCMLSAIVEGCLYNEFLEEVYENPDISVAQIDEIFNNLVKEYGVEDYYYTWEDVRHNYDTPFYYISYSVSAIPALEIWSMTEKNYEGAVNTYLSLIKDPDEMTFMETIQQAGLNDPLAKETLIKIINSVCYAYGFEQVN